MRGRGASTGRLLADIRRLARLLGHSPSSVEYRRLGKYNIRTLHKKFNAPWKEIVGLSGLRYVSRTCRRIAATEELREDILRVARRVGHPPTCTEYLEHGWFGYGVIKRRSGQRRWEDAVATLTGLDRGEIKRHQMRGGMRYRTTEERLARLREIAKELGHTPSTQEAGSRGINAHNLSRQVGGNWEEVLKAAGLDLRRRSRHAIILSTATETLLEDVLTVARSLGHIPTVREYSLHGRYPYSSLRRRLGGWRNVKKIVGERAGSSFPQS